MEDGMEKTEQGLNLNEIGQIAIAVQNLQEATEFYRDVLGMRFLFEAGTMVFFQCGAVRLMIGTSDKNPGRDGTILYFRVPDIQQAHALLGQKSVNFVQEPHLVARMKTHDLWLAFLKDPAGNTLGLMSEVERN
jgi:methylmalonyl-CoA/ethylmalonyl-CoA epimerase